MKKAELESLLKKARLPEIPEESLEMFTRSVIFRLKRPASPVHHGRRVSPLLWAFGLAACVLVAVGIGYARMRNRASLPQDDVLANLKVIRETLAVFPNRVRAIVEDEHGWNVVLSEAGNVPVSPPIYVRFCDGKQCSSLVTFSGQEIQVAGQKVLILSDARGGIILSGDQFVWASTEKISVGNHFKIEAKTLGPATM